MAGQTESSVPPQREGRWSVPILLCACMAVGALIALGGDLAALVALGLIALFGGVVWLPYVVIGCLALYLPFESIIIYRLPPSGYVAAKHALTALSGLLALGLLGRAAASRFLGNRRQQFLPPPPGTLPFVLFAGWIFLAALVTGSGAQWPIKMLVQEARFFPLFFALVLAVPSRRVVKKLVVILFVAAGIQAFLGVGQITLGDPVGQALTLPEVQSEDITYATGSNPNTTSAGRIRIAGTTGSYNTFGVYISFFILLLTGLLQEYGKSLAPAARWGVRGVILLGLVLVVFSYSRMTLAGLAIGFVTIAWFRRDWRIPAALTLIATIIVILFFFDDTDYSQFEDRGEVRWIQKVKSSMTPERFQTSKEVGRVGVTLYALNIAGESPLFGVGPGNWGNPLALTYDEHTRYVLWRDNIPFEYFYLQDNNWASTLGQIGIPGALAFLAIFVRLFLQAARGYWRHREPWVRFLCLGFAAVTACYVVEGLFQPNFVIRMIAFNYWILAGLVMALLRSTSPHQEGEELREP
jgi:hypothetical protein